MENLQDVSRTAMKKKVAQARMSSPVRKEFAADLSSFAPLLFFRSQELLRSFKDPSALA